MSGADWAVTLAVTVLLTPFAAAYLASVTPRRASVSARERARSSR